MWGFKGTMGFAGYMRFNGGFNEIFMGYQWDHGYGARDSHDDCTEVGR